MSWQSYWCCLLLSFLLNSHETLLQKILPLILTNTMENQLLILSVLYATLKKNLVKTSNYLLWTQLNVRKY